MAYYIFGYCRFADSAGGGLSQLVVSNLVKGTISPCLKYADFGVARKSSLKTCDIHTPG